MLFIVHCDKMFMYLFFQRPSALFTLSLGNWEPLDTLWFNPSPTVSRKRGMHELKPGRLD